MLTHRLLMGVPQASGAPAAWNRPPKACVAWALKTPIDIQNVKPALKSKLLENYALGG